METMIVVIIQMKIHSTVPNGHVRKTAFDAPTIAASPPLGTVMETMIVVMELMNHQNTVVLKAVRASEISLLATMVIVYPGYTFAMEIMIVWITVMKMTDISAMSASVMPKLNLRVKKTRPGDGHNAFRESGCAMEIPIVLMEQTKTLHYTTAPHLNLARKINLPARTADASTKVGCVTMTMIAEMVPMKENNAIPNTKPAQRKSSLVRISNVSEAILDVTERMIVVIIRMK